jgi:hypothetical protein
MNRSAYSAFALALAACSNSDKGVGGDDQNGISGGTASFAVTVNDTAFMPTILTTENLSTVTLTLTNAGTKPHGFMVQCMGNACFPDMAKIAPIDANATAMITFMVPFTEGIFTFASGAPGDTQTGQFIVK